ncbi:hypothetical protein CRP19_000072 [Riemerella phage vB_RanS_CRP19]|nr:hypothetical protein CRP19_000072 [Riemerella phage vB_RanS_CRP19]
MTAKEFLTENRERVISYYNTEINPYYSVSLKDFMLDLLNNFRKATKAEVVGYTKTDLSANLMDAKSRLGCFDKIEIAVRYSKPYSQSNQAKRERYYGVEKARQLNQL